MCHSTVAVAAAGQSLEFIPPPHLLEVNAIISLFGLQGITGPRGTFHFYFSGFQLIVAH